MEGAHMKSLLSMRRKLIAHIQERQKVCDDLDDERHFAEINVEAARDTLDKFDKRHPEVEALYNCKIGG